MADDGVSATTVINSSAEANFAVLGDPATHAAIDGTGWVSEAVDGKPLTAGGQSFRMSMYHVDHPDARPPRRSGEQSIPLARFRCSWEVPESPPAAHPRAGCH